MISLCILTIFKNESLGMVEWLDHYINQGASHFFMLDNNSSSDEYIEKIKPYQDKVTLLKAAKNFAQREHYNSCIEYVKKYDFVLVVDLDEYMYVKGLKTTLQEYCSNLPENIGQVSVSWSMFSSSGLKTQPKSIKDSFVWRHADFGCDVKSLVRTNKLIEFEIHVHKIDNNYISYKDDKLLKLNHYVIQSLEFWQNVKMTRGDVTDNFIVNPRNMDYFNRYDRSEVFDNELASLKLKVISFAIWGDNPMFNIGAIRNVELALKYYPEFTCVFYVYNIPDETIQKLNSFGNVKIIYKSELPTKGRACAWRFEAYDLPGVELFMSRDTDTRILTREVSAVREWLESNQTFHIMRDSPCHYPAILGGMFGCRKIPNFLNMTERIDDFFSKNQETDDQKFLESVIHPLIKESVIVHDEIKKYEGSKCRQFPIKYDLDCNFVGQYVYEDELRHEEKYDTPFHQMLKNFIRTYIPDRIEKNVKVDTVLVACDLNPTYIDFFPIVKKTWKDIVGIDIVLILVADKIPEQFNEYANDIILFTPIENIPTAFQAQCIRLLYPGLLKTENSVIISDMDLIPLSKKYYVDVPATDSNFIVYRSDAIHNEYPMCFCSAVPDIWKSIFKIKDVISIKTRITEWYSSVNDYVISGPYSKGWATDQNKLYEYLQKTLHKVILLKDSDTKFNRLDRMNLEMISNNLDIVKNDKYTDFHLPRPYKKYFNLINGVINRIVCLK